MTRKEKYIEALNHLKQAENLLMEIGKEDQRDYDSGSFAFEVSQIISCDHGEAGLEAFIKTIK